MKTITVRGIDPELDEMLKGIAKQEGKSLNQLAVDALKQRCGLNKEKKYTKIHHDLDHLFGSWTQREFDQVQGKIDSESNIDPELWK